MPPTTKVKSGAWKAGCRTCIGITVFLRILPTATWRPGAAERGVLEPGTATAHLTATGVETVIGIVIGTATGIEMTTVMDIMTTGGIADGTNTITTTTATRTKTATTTAKSR